MARNWVFNLFLACAIEQHKQDTELAEALQIAIYHNGLHLDGMRERKGILADRTLAALQQTASQIIRKGAADLPDLEAQGQIMFLEAIADFLALIEKHRQTD